MKKRMLLISILVILSLCLSACSQPQQPAPSVTPTAVPATIPPSSAPTPEQTPPAEQAPTPTQEPAPSPVPTEELSNSDLLDAIEGKYGVEIYWNAVIQPFSDFAIYEVKDDELVRRFLLLLDKELARYPEGFFKKAKELEHAFRFFASDMIIAINTDNMVTMGGFQSSAFEGYTDIAIDVQEFNSYSWPDVQTESGAPYIEYVVHHEIGHAISSLIFLNDFGGDFSLTEWYDTLLPKDYTYYDMQDPKEREKMTLSEYASPYITQSAKGIWFPDIYSQLDFKEHQTALFAYAMMPDPPYEWKSENVQKQVAYMFPFIRKTLGTDSWPETTEWEAAAAAPLQDAGEHRR